MGALGGTGLSPWAQMGTWPLKFSLGPHDPNMGLGRRRQRCLHIKQRLLWTPG